MSQRWVESGLLAPGDSHEHSPFVRAAVHAAKNSLVRTLLLGTSWLAQRTTSVVLSQAQTNSDAGGICGRTAQAQPALCLPERAYSIEHVLLPCINMCAATFHVQPRQGRCG